MCRAHATVRGLIGELVARSNHSRDIVLDMEAGLEHLTRGTARHVTRFLAVLEPYYRSMETARRVVELAKELNVPDVVVVANKVRDTGDRAAIAEFCAAHDMRLGAEIPYDPVLLEAERSGAAPIDYRQESPAVSAVKALAQSLQASAA